MNLYPSYERIGQVREPKWVTEDIIVAVHTDQVKEHGGSHGLRDANALASALARPANKFQYQKDIDIFDLAAAYGFGLCKNHPFVDGNKRVSFQSMYIFLGINGFRLAASEESVVEVMLSLATGGTNESRLSEWLRANSRGK